jgi:hypothetical protein
VALVFPLMIFLASNRHWPPATRVFEVPQIPLHTASCWPMAATGTASALRQVACFSPGTRLALGFHPQGTLLAAACS